MKTAPALALIAVGAILAFAVHADLRFFSFQIAGWVIMLAGIAGLVIPRRGYGWVRRVTRRPRAAVGSGGDRRPRRVARRAGTRGPHSWVRTPTPTGWRYRRRPSPAAVPSLPPDPAAGEAVDGTAPGPGPPDETVEEEFFQE
ncbi:MAG TPA: hypothetical protein VIX86_25750 [Streptosporangiaceae bacterium]